MSTDADGVTIHNIVWSNITMVSSVHMLSGGGADIYLEDVDGDELNLELEEDAARMLRNELLALYPFEEGEDMRPLSALGDPLP
jgi:hypothetical protein